MNIMNLIPSIHLLNKHKHLCLWPASTCNSHPKTLSFRATTTHQDHHKDPEVVVVMDQATTTLGSCFTNSSETTESVSTDSDYSAVETILRGACRPQRLFFEHDSTSSILETTITSGGNRQCSTTMLENGGGLVDKESVAVVMESHNPYVDFKKSMEEMVEIHGLEDWDCLEELLGWYLRMNDKSNHDFIIGAFIDLLAGISGGGGGCRGGCGGVSFLDLIVHPQG